jgi:hypothetical protein
MKIKDVFILKEAADDLNEGRTFYDLQEPGVGDYFWDSILADIESLIIYAGIHQKKCGLHQMFAKRFPYSIYYEIAKKTAYVAAVLPMRRDPVLILKRLTKKP